MSHRPVLHRIQTQCAITTDFNHLHCTSALYGSYRLHGSKKPAETWSVRLLLLDGSPASLV